LPPELCRPTGIPDNTKKDFNFQNEVKPIKFINPNKKMSLSEEMLKAAKKVMPQFLEISSTPMKLDEQKQFDMPIIHTFDQKLAASQKGINVDKPIEPFTLNEWTIVYSSKDSN
jgi:hypothetical protein